MPSQKHKPGKCQDKPKEYQLTPIWDQMLAEGRGVLSIPGIDYPSEWDTAIEAVRASQKPDPAYIEPF